MKTKLATVAVFLAVLATPVGLFAAETAPPTIDPPAAPESSQEPPGEGDVVPLAKGAPAPFLGLLVPEGRFVELLEAENEVRELRAKLAAKERTAELVEQAYLRRLEQATAPPPWYESPTFNRWLGFGLGLAAAGLAVWGSVELVGATNGP